jgi:hypothetical protein
MCDIPASPKQPYDEHYDMAATTVTWQKFKLKTLSTQAMRSLSQREAHTKLRHYPPAPGAGEKRSAAGAGIRARLLTGRLRRALRAGREPFSGLYWPGLAICAVLGGLGA